MKFNSKMRRVQQNYREAIEQNGKKKKHTVEAVIVICLLGSLVLLSELVGGHFKITDSDQMFVESKADDESNWMRILPEIDNNLNQLTDEYKGISIDFNPKPIKYIVRTSFQDPYNEKVNELVNVSNEIIKSHNLPALQKEKKTYEIIVIGKSNVELTRGMFRKREDF
ncbi:hypothetical protein WQ54_04510 [Bacillus sp. SA1-12]|uniref:hypothetical protein n=1 Tax=Bacillus sp. SA1-12 TaxID=1455638 RepID=UPI000625D2AC|nr:hypothetical protein [Bacillus sp. SA1-12]KKI93494.1 hypothetical protein WQ54_04510 [Bacillus sp. SA1-12]